MAVDSNGDSGSVIVEDACSFKASKGARVELECRAKSGGVLSDEGIRSDGLGSRKAAAIDPYFSVQKDSDGMYVETVAPKANLEGFHGGLNDLVLPL